MYRYAHSTYFSRPPEIPFSLGDVRAFVNSPMEEEVASENFVYRADGAIRINREALLGYYNVVLRDVVRLSGLQRDDVHETLQEVLDKIADARTNARNPRGGYLG